MQSSAAAAGFLADPLPDVGWSDLGSVSVTVAIIAVVAIIVGIFALHALSRRSIGLQLTMISAVTVVTSLAGVGGITWLMLGDTGYRTIVMELLVIAGVAGFVVALIVGRRLTGASRSLLESVQKTGDSGLYIPPTRALPAELAGLSDGLSAAHERLAQARARERALESSRRELVAWSATTCVLRWRACGPWPRRWKTRWWSTRARSAPTTPRSGARRTGSR